jgi:hypothetical protein
MFTRLIEVVQKQQDLIDGQRQQIREFAEKVNILQA